MMLNRRSWIFGAGLSAASTLGHASSPAIQTETAGHTTSFAEPYFRPQTFGARGDGIAADTAAIQAAMDAAHKAGGGTVHLSAGTYLSGTLRLRSHVSLWLDNGATLLMSPKNEDFLLDDSKRIAPGGYETNEESNALLFGDTVENICVFGEGVIEGNRKRRGGPKPVFLRNCSHIVLRGLTFRNAPEYAVSLYLCARALIDGISILNGHADGIDLDCCRWVRVTGCVVESVDDSLCLKATQPSSARGVTEQIAVSHCIFRTASIHFKCGTESCGDFRDIAVSNCTFEGGMGWRHANPGIALYTVDGGNLESVSITNIVMRNVATPFAILLGNRDAWHLGRGPGRLRDISISHVIANGASFPSVIAGIPDHRVDGIRFFDIMVRMQSANKIDNKIKDLRSKALAGVDPFDVIEQPKHYPEPIMFGHLPASVLYMRHVKDMELCDLRNSSEDDETNPAIVGDDVDQLRMQLQIANETSSVWLRNIRDSFIDILSLGSHTKSQLRFSGHETRGVFCRANGSFNKKSQVVLSPDIAVHAVTLV